MQDQNDIIGARSASLLASNSVAVISEEGLRSLASLPSHCNHKYTMQSNLCVLDRILSRIGTGKGVVHRLPFL